MNPSNNTDSSTLKNVQGVPTEWPGAFGIYKYSRPAVLRNLGMLLAVIALSLVVNFIIGTAVTAASLPVIISSLLQFLVSAALSVMVTQLLIAGVHGQSLSQNQILNNRLLPLTLQMIGLNLLLFVTSAVSIALFVIPAFFVIPRLTLAPYFLVDKNMGFFDAFSASWQATHGNVGKVWGIVGASIAMLLLALTIIGIPFSVYFLFGYSAAYAVLYVYIDQRHSAAAPAPAPNPAPAQ